MSKTVLLGIGIATVVGVAIYKAKEAKAKASADPNDPNGPAANEVVLSNGTVVVVKGFTQLYKGPGDKPTAESEALLKDLPKEVVDALVKLEQTAEAANGKWFNPTTQVTVAGREKYLALYDENFNLVVYSAPEKAKTVFKNA